MYVMLELENVGNKQKIIREMATFKDPVLFCTCKVYMYYMY